MAHARAELMDSIDTGPAAPAGQPRRQPRPGGKWSDFGIRLLSAAILGPVALLALWHGGFAWIVLIAVAFVGLGAEWARLAARPGLRFLLPASLLLVLAAMLTGGWPAGLAVMLAAMLLLVRPFGWFAALGVPYAGIGGLSLLWLRLHSPAGLHDTLFLVAVIWATDIGAYLAGRLLGGRKLAPTISPGKTWTGAAGGLLLAAAAGVTLAGMNGLALPAAVLLSLFAQGGDLLESAIKRKCGVKDSGRTIPGHGGLFDRLDGFLTAAPLAAILALSVHGGLPVWR